MLTKEKNMLVINYKKHTMYKMYSIMWLLALFFSNNIYGQGCYPFKYNITNSIKPDTYSVTYQEKTSFLNGQPDSILIVIIDTVSVPSDYKSAIVSYPDRKIHVDFYKTDTAKIEYSSELGIKMETMNCPFNEYYIIKDTSKTHVVAKITIETGHCHYSRRAIYSKIPLRKKTIKAIREYIYNKGPEPSCIKKKTCYVTLPEL